MAFLDDVLVGIKTIGDATGGPEVPVNAKSRHLRISGDGVAVSGSDDAVDLIIQGADAPRAKVVATSNLTLAGAQTIDGVSCGVEDVVLLTAQTTASENRLWVVQAGAWTPAPDMTTSAQIKAGMLVSVRLGTANASTIWQLATGGPFTLGVTALSWQKAGGASLAVATPSAAAAPVVGVSSRAMREDASFGTAIATGQPSARHGFFHSDDKRLHDRHHETAVYFKPSGDTSGLTDPDNWDAAVDEVLTKNAKRLVILPGVFYVHSSKDLDCDNLQGVEIVGPGFRTTTPSYIVGVGPRSAGAIFNLRRCNYVRLFGVYIECGAITAGIDVRYDSGGSTGDPTGITIDSCKINGCTTGVAGQTSVKATSTSSRTLVPGTITFALAGSPSAADYPANSYVWLNSRGAPLVEAFATVVSLVGNTLTLTIDSSYATDCISDGGAHSDWDLYVVNVGIITGTTDLFEVRNCNFGTLGWAAELQGNGLTWRRNNTTSGPMGYQIKGRAGSQGIEIEASQHANHRVNNRGCYVSIADAQSPVVQACSGDQAQAGPLICFTSTEHPTLKNSRLFMNAPGTPASQSVIWAINTVNANIEKSVRAAGISGTYFLDSPGAAGNTNFRAVPGYVTGVSAMLAPGFLFGDDYVIPQDNQTQYLRSLQAYSSAVTVGYAGSANFNPETGLLSYGRWSGASAKTWTSGKGPLIAGNASVQKPGLYPAQTLIIMPEHVAGAGIAIPCDDSGASDGTGWAGGLIFNKLGLKISLTDTKTSQYIEVTSAGNLDINGMRLEDLGTPTAANHASTKAYVDSYAIQGVLDDGNSGTADTLTFSSTSCAHKSTLTGNAMYTINWPTEVGSFVLEIWQDGTGGRTVTFPASVVNGAAVTALLVTTLSTRSVVSFYWNGTNAVASLIATGLTS